MAVKQMPDVLQIIILLCVKISLTHCQSNQSEIQTSPVDTYELVIDGEFSEDVHDCRIFTENPYLYTKVRLMVENKVKLMEYTLEFPRYEENPLMVNNTLNHRPKTWARVTQQHGQTLLALAFNYGVLSLMTLTFGVENMVIDLVDDPPGCIWNMKEERKIGTVMHLLMRDFQNSTDITLVEQERICHEIIIVDEQGYANFKDRCCSKSSSSNKPVCTTDIINIWLILLRIMLTVVRYGIIFFGPLWFIGVMELLATEKPPFKVKLKEPLKKTVIVAKSDTPITLEYEHKLDFRREKKFPRLRESVKDIPIGVPTKIKINEYDIVINYSKLLTENNVPVGLWTQISRNFFLCKIRDVGPFVQCCTRNIFSTCPAKRKRSWISCWSKVGLILMILLIPFPFYIRLYVFYQFEKPEVFGRKEAIEKLGAKEPYGNSLIHYLTPVHGLFIFIYIIYFVTAIILAYMSRSSEGGKFKRIIIGSFMDLKHLKWIDVVALVVSNIIWPFSRYGGMGFLIALIYWPIAIPLNLIIFACYCLPSVYLTIRMMFYSKTGLLDQIRAKGKLRIGYRRLNRYDQSMHLFETGRLLGDGSRERKKIEAVAYGDDGVENVSHMSEEVPDSLVDEEEMEDEEFKDGSDEEDIELGLVKNDEKAASIAGEEHELADTIFVEQGWREIIEHIGASLLCIITMFAVLLILSECVGSLVEMLVFTTMGIIVNAGQVLKYVTLLLLVLLYSYDCFNNVGKKYLKLNKALFGEIKARIKDLADVTRLPSHLQENTGFKSEQLSEQAEGELPDEVSIRRGHHKKWMINDLVLFVDNEDMPRIPKELFEHVCQIRVAGAPGPIYQSHIEAFKQFLIILCFLMFVFIVVLSFGAVYKVSSTNQMMATMAGGFMPFILKTFMQPSRPDIEIGSVSFKSKLDEIIRRFHQKWPMHDFPFELWTAEDDEEEREREEGDKDSVEAQTESVGTQTDSHDINSGIRMPPTYDKAVLLSKANDKTADAAAADVGSDEAESQGESEITNVDYLIYIPEKCDTKWLNEWSDLDEVDIDPADSKRKTIEHGFDDVNSNNRTMEKNAAV